MNGKPLYMLTHSILSCLHSKHVRACWWSDFVVKSPRLAEDCSTEKASLKKNSSFGDFYFNYSLVCVYASYFVSHSSLEYRHLYQLARFLKIPFQVTHFLWFRKTTGTHSCNHLLRLNAYWRHICELPISKPAILIDSLLVKSREEQKENLRGMCGFLMPEKSASYDCLIQRRYCLMPIRKTLLYTRFHFRLMYTRCAATFHFRLLKLWHRAWMVRNNNKLFLGANLFFYSHFMCTL